MSLPPALRLVVGVSIAALAWAWSVPQDGRAFSTTGDVLDLSQRDLRIHDNFTHAGLHENQVPDPNWPGFLEVELALWKAAAEWGSAPFGDGSGDPSQLVVGSGLANFDFLWNGEASGIGTTNDNIVSMIPGNGGGVAAFIESPTSDGWRIRMYESVPWDDGPGLAAAGRIDFQGVAAHYLGHALGLGHSFDPTATMFATLGGTGELARSIENDDALGIQSVYGAADPTKPIVTGVSGALFGGEEVVLSGASFHPTHNEVWLNSSLLDAGAAGGEPTKITGVPSQNGGTQLCFTLPVNSFESGAVHVKVPGSGNETLSVGYPFAAGTSDVDSIVLSGPASATVGSTVTYTLAAAPPNAEYWLFYSSGLGCFVRNGHKFDLAAPVTLAFQGTTDASGNASWTSTPLPPGAAGRTFHVEAAARDGAGLADSNAIQLDVS